MERFPKSSITRAEKPGQRIHTDIMGPMPQPSLGGSRYIIVFTDDYSQKSWTYFLKAKSEAFSRFYKFKEQIEVQTGNKLQVLRSDRGGEYLSEEFINYCSIHGIQRELTQAHIPQQNGVSEQRNRTILERARCMSHDCQLPIYLWTKAIATATYLINRSPTRANHGETPEARFTGMKPDISNLRIFGCLAYVHVPRENRNKLDSKTQKCLFLGFDKETKAYCLYDHSRRKVIIRRDVVFEENKVGYKYLACSDPTDNTLHIPISDLQLNSVRAEPEIPLMPDVDSEHIDDDPQSSIETNPTSDLSLTPTLRDPAKHARRYKQTQGKNSSTWFSTKGRTRLQRYFCSCCQVVYNFDYFCVSCPKSLDTCQMDVITAFLNGTLNEEIYMEIPDGFPFAGDATKVCKIKKALYGLKQAPKAWYERINSWLLSQGLSRSKNDPNLYFSRKDGKLTILLYMWMTYSLPATIS